MTNDLTQRECGVLAALADGMNANEIGADLFISSATVKSHAKHIYRKLGAKNAAHAVALGYHRGILRVPVSA